MPEAHTLRVVRETSAEFVNGGGAVGSVHEDWKLGFRDMCKRAVGAMGGGGASCCGNVQIRHV